MLAKSKITDRNGDSEANAADTNESQGQAKVSDSVNTDGYKCVAIIWRQRKAIRI